MRHIIPYIIPRVNLFIWFLLSICGAQVIEGNVQLSSQEEVNSFSGTSITGDLHISGTDIVDLSKLSTLTSIGSNLVLFQNTVLTNIDGLDNLDSVGKDLLLDYNPMLANIDGLNNLEFIGAELRILHQDVLTNLDGLGNLSSVGKNLTIENNTKLTNLDGFINLGTIPGDLSIDRNTLLANLDGLINLTSVTGHLYVVNNNALASFCGLFTLLNTNGLSGNYNVNYNLVNPTQQQIIDGGSCITSIDIEDDEYTSLRYDLMQNYPNPFNPVTTIKYQIKHANHVNLSVYNSAAEKLKTLVNKNQNSGQYTVSFDAADLASGVYFYKLKVGPFEQSRKMLLLR